MNVKCLNHPETTPQPQSMGKLSAVKPVPDAKKVGGRWASGSYWHEGEVKNTEPSHSDHDWPFHLIFQTHSVLQSGGAGGDADKRTSPHCVPRPWRWCGDASFLILSDLLF